MQSATGSRDEDDELEKTVARVTKLMEANEFPNHVQELHANNRIAPTTGGEIRTIESWFRMTPNITVHNRDGITRNDRLIAAHSSRLAAELLASAASVIQYRHKLSKRHKT